MPNSSLRRLRCPLVCRLWKQDSNRRHCQLASTAFRSSRSGLFNSPFLPPRSPSLSLPSLQSSSSTIFERSHLLPFFILPCSSGTVPLLGRHPPLRPTPTLPRRPTDGERDLPPEIGQGQHKDQVAEEPLQDARLLWMYASRLGSSVSLLPLPPFPFLSFLFGLNGIRSLTDPLHSFGVLQAGADDLDKFVSFVGSFCCIPLCFMYVPRPCPLASCLLFFRYLSPPAFIPTPPTTSLTCLPFPFLSTLFSLRTNNPSYPPLLHMRSGPISQTAKNLDILMIVFGFSTSIYTTYQTIVLLFG
jgi:hypothetical protein